MAELSTIARPYADALFETARASGEGLERWLVVVEELAALMSHPQVAQVVADPKLDDAQVVDLLSSLVQQPLPANGTNFLKLLAANQRLAALPEVWHASVRAALVVVVVARAAGVGGPVAVPTTVEPSRPPVAPWSAPGPTAEMVQWV
jgi:F0F1-type ATP synthase delta subunit